MTLRIGTNPIAWSNDDMPDLGRDIPLETCLAEARRAGYAGIEMGHKFPRLASELRPLLDRHGLALISGWYSARLLERSVEAELRAMEDHLSLLQSMGCPVMVFAEVSGSVAGERGIPMSRRPRLGDADWHGFGEKLTAVAGHLARRGVHMAYHHHAGTVVETAAEIDRLMAETGPEVGLLLDTGHLAVAGADPAAVARRHARRINHVHCKDVRRDVLAGAKTRDLSFLDAVLAGVFTVPGDGAIDFVPALTALEETGYHGWLVVEAEQDPAKAPPLAYATAGYRYLRECIGRIGWDVAGCS